MYKGQVEAIAPAAVPIRGIYSQIILNDDVDRDTLQLKAPSVLPPVVDNHGKKQTFSATLKQVAPLRPLQSSQSPTESHGHYHGEVTRSSQKRKLDYRKSLEPKVFLPFVSK